MGFKQFLKNNWRLVNANNLLTNRFANTVLESQITGYAQKSVVNTLQFPPKPKKPNPPFFQFLKEKRLEVAEKHNLKSKDAINVISEMWRQFDVDAKKKMTEMYNIELEKYKENMKNYKESLTDDQRNELFRIKYQQVEQKTKRKLKRELKELGRPRKPPTAYLIFVTEEMKKRGNVPVKTYMAMVGNKWKELDTESKTKYIKAASVENDNYNTELLKWESDMIKAGRIDLVRSYAISDDTN